MKFIREFNEFAIKGNIVDLAVAVIIGAAFGAIVSSMVDDIITPLLLTPALEAAGVNDIDKLMWGAVKYGKFLSALIKFILVAFVLFALIKAINALKKKQTETPVVTSTTDALLMEIRDSLKNKN